MHKTLSFIFFLFFACNNLMAQFDNSVYSKVKINLENKDIRDLARLGLEVDHGIVKVGKYIINDFSEHEIQLIEDADFQYEILIADVKAWYKDQTRIHSHENTLKSTHSNNCEETSNAPQYETPENYTYGSMGGYLTYSEMLVVLDSMVAKFPNLITPRNNIGTPADTTWMGNRIFWMKISDNPNMNEATEPEVLFTSLHHAREPNSLSQNIFYMWYLLENYDTDSEIKYLVDETEIYFIPCVNPDGYILNELMDPNGGGMIRKNARDNNNNGSFQANQDGVDLNRNYGYQWAYDNAGSSPNSNSQTYRGPSAFSEPETKAVKMFCDAHEIEITLNYHTYGNLLIHPWGYSDVVTSEHATFSVFGKEMTQYNNYIFGTGSMTVGYETNGDSDDWMYGETVSKGRIYSLTPEAGDDIAGFWPAIADIDKYNKANMHQNLSASRLVLNYVEQTESSANIISSLTGSLEFEFIKKGLKTGDVNIYFTALNSKMNLVSNSEVLSLEHLDIQNLSLPFTLNTKPNNNEQLDVLVAIDNGLHTYYDTIRKIFIYGDYQTVFEDNTNDLTNWIGSAWSLSNTDFHSAPNSITESPNGNYSSNQNKRLTIKNPVDLTDAISAKISFWAKWEIENDYDYAQVLISIDNGLNYTPLCGKYTNNGSSNQDLGNPFYDNVQTNWVKEEMDITEYVGNKIIVQFYFYSDQGLNLDGFFFDDFEVNMIKSIKDTTSITEINSEDIIISPNPVNNILNIQILENAKTFEINIFNYLGQRINLEMVENGKDNFEIDFSNETKGMYFLNFINEGKLSVYKFIKN